jgi:hypothetical protein
MLGGVMMMSRRFRCVATIGLFLLMSASMLMAADNRYAVEGILLPNGDIVGRATTPLPPPEVRAPVAYMPADAALAPVLLSNVPAFDWCYGCAATSGAMAAGFYDNNGYGNMYAGPTNGGVCPLTNTSWGSGECPLSATHQGYDGLGVRGHVDDYWVAYQSSAVDPYITGGWTEHTHADCTGDFMKTNQSAYGNSDGATTFYYYPSGSPYSGPGSSNDDGAYGLNLFYQSRGYTVLSYYTQLIYGWDGNTAGFTFAQYMQEIDAGRPVLIHVEGHTMLGFGYDTVGNVVWLHDTWDHSAHTMTWGQWYPYGANQLWHWGVTCVELEATNMIFQDGFESGNSNAWSATVD